MHRVAAARLRPVPPLGFDLSREAGVGGDETWVRPYAFSTPPSTSDVLFVLARFRPRTQTRESGLVTFRFVEGTPAMDGIVLFTPAYRFASADGQSIRDSEAREILGRSDAREFFPMGYEAAVPVGARSLELKVMLHLQPD